MLAVLLTLTVVVPQLLPSPVAGEQPVVTGTYPEDGDVLEEPPSRIRICFVDPVNIRDLTEGGDFGFTVTAPEGRALGLRIVFRGSGLGVDVFPGFTDGPTEGDWAVEWRVTDPDTLEPTAGTIDFAVEPGGSPVPEEPPVFCAGDTSMEEATPVDGEPSEAGDQGAKEDGDEGDEGSNTFLVVVIAAVAVAATVLGLVVLLARRRHKRRVSGDR